MSEDINWRKYAARFRTYPPLIRDEIDPGVKMIISIPVYAEPDILSTLESLNRCELGVFKVEVIFLFNKSSLMSAADQDLHRQSWDQCLNWVAHHQKDKIRFLPVYLDELPDPIGGVGWARKIVMDEAARRLDGNGIIVCLDADCIVSDNYFLAIHQHFEENKSCDAVSIFIEHPLDHLTAENKEAIIQYELDLRYLINAQQWCGHPFSFQTIGSAMAVRRKAYLDQGGMNTKRAGEDFYFLQKFIEIESYQEIRNTTVYPSARISSRVPFGTGKAMQLMLEDEEEWITTNFEIFRRIKPLFQSLDKLRALSMHEFNKESYTTLQQSIGLSVDVVGFLEQLEFLEKCKEIGMHTASIGAFRKRFFRYFNSFRMIKFMHYMRDHHFPDTMVIDGVIKLMKEMKLPATHKSSHEDLLKLLRQHDRGDGIE